MDSVSIRRAANGFVVDAYRSAMPTPDTANSAANYSVFVFATAQEAAAKAAELLSA